MITIEKARGYYRDADAIHDFDHVLRVLALAERLAEAEGADWEIVRTAVLLHDVARGQNGEHAAAGAEFARDLLAGHPPERVEAVAQAIAAHRFRTGPAPQTLEAQVVYDADKLDVIGAIGVARAFAYGGHHGQPLWGEVAADYRASPTTGHEHTPVHEFHFKLVKIKDRLLTESARQLAGERHTFMVAFYKRLEREVRGRA